VAVPQLILLNGPPASGKSTMAQLLVAARPLALNLDVDVVRGSLGGWSEQPDTAGLAARRLAVAMATVHLTDGHDVVVPQLLARDTFIVELEAVADATGAQFVEIALVVDREEAVRSFRLRSTAPGNQQHRDAAELAERSGGLDAVGELYDRLMRFLDGRPSVRRVPVTYGDVVATLRLVEAAIAAEP